MTETELSERQQKILELVVREHVTSAQPVGSEMLSRRKLGVSSATIRNELAWLEAEGYLTHPHTSAGRVPTERGYRYFVERLMEDSELPVAEQRMISHQFHQVTLDIDQWMQLSAAVLAHTAHSAALVTAPRAKHARVKHVELIAINERSALLVLVLQESVVKQQILYLPQIYNQDELTRVTNRLNALLVGLDGEQIRVRPLGLTNFEAQVVEVVAGMMDALDRRSTREVYRDGIIDILRQPEFGIGTRMQHLLEILEQRSLLDEVLSELAPPSGVQVVIGREGGHAELSDYALVLARYGMAEEASGVVSVLGPIRLPYQRAVSVVRYVSHLLDELMGQFHSGR